MAGLSTTILREAINLDSSSTLQHFRDDPFVDPAHMDHSYKITFWPVTSKFMNGFTTTNKQHIAQLGVQQIFHGFGDLSKNENSMIILAIIDKAQKIKYIVSSFDLFETCRTC